MKKNDKQTEADLVSSEHQKPTRAWELIEAGRYQPRRIRGSLRGRELG